MHKKIFYTIPVWILIFCFVIPGIAAEDDTETIYNLCTKVVELVNSGNYEKAIPYLNVLLETDDERLAKAVLYRVRAEAHANLRNYDQAARDYQEAMILDPEGKEDYLRPGGWCFLVAGNFAEARKIFEEIYQYDQEMVVCFNLGYTYAFTGDLEKAREYYREGLALIENEDQLDIPLMRLRYMQENGLDEALCTREAAWIEDQYNFNYQYYNLSDQTHDKAVDLATEKKYLAAADMYALAAEIERKSREPRLKDIYWDLSKAGKYYLAMDQLESAKKMYLEMMELNKTIASDLNQVEILAHLGQIYYRYGSYEKALKVLNESMEIIDNHQDSFFYELQIPYVSNNMGMIYTSWGDYEQAVEYFQMCLKVANKNSYFLKGYIPLAQVNLGVLYQRLGDHDRALKIYKESLSHFMETGEDRRVAKLYSNIGVLLMEMEHYDEALDYCKQSLSIYEKIKYKGGTKGVVYANIASLYLNQKEPGKAIEYYNKALSLFQEMKMKTEQARAYNNLGYVYAALKDYKKASDLLLKAVKIAEEIRENAPDDEQKRSYLELVIHTYQQLIAVYIRNGQLDQAFNIMEISKARVLADNLSGQKLNLSIPYLEEVRADLLAGEGLIIFANANREKLIEMVVSSEEKSAREVDKRKFITTVREEYGKAIDKMVARERRIKNLQSIDSNSLVIDKKTDEEFKNIIHYYRKLLVQKDQSKLISRALYDLLIEPLEEELRGKEELIIVPDGILNFIPFETLIDAEGNYLVEKFKIRYIQSQTVASIIDRRKYSTDRKEVIAFGGAVYDQETYKQDGDNIALVENEAQLSYLQKQLDETLKKRGGVNDFYGRLGYGNWQNLPGTLEEIRQIKSIIKNSQLIYGDKVSEERVKELSSRGELARYKVLHFATHGIVVPELPELSALVLSQKDKYQLEDEKEEKETRSNQEDGYLRMGEIADLKIKADFVNLSACETGLGKIYAGEGVVGLTQSFLLAGANSLSVSLWSVSDESTARFMTALYQLAYQKGFTYDEAMNQVKLMFIRGEFGEEYKTPYYWAPFVYYGS